MKLHKIFLIHSFLLSLFISFSASALDCQNPRTQTDMNQCSTLELDHETKIINKTYSALKAKLNSVQKQEIKEVQLAWIKFKDLACQFEASGVEGGSIHATVLASCLAEKTRQRNKQLKAIDNCEEGDLSCPAR